MTIYPIDKSQRKAARVAGFAYLVTFATVVYVNFGIHDRLIVANNAAETARNILAHARLFRIGIVGDLLYCAGVIVLLTALYVILKPVNQALALLAAFWRLVWVLMWLVMTLNLFDALRLLGGKRLRRHRYLSAHVEGAAWALVANGCPAPVVLRKGSPRAEAHPCNMLHGLLGCYSFQMRSYCNSGEA